MERIKDKFDDLNNKARPGSTYVSGFNVPGRTDNLRSIDIDGSQMQFEPNSRYYASCTIRRGEAVSIAQLQDLSEELKGDKFAYVKVSDPDLDETCLGIATNYAEPGQIVHIQRSGKFNYLTTDSILCTPGRQAKEVFLKTTNWDFDSVRGQRIFLKKKYNFATQEGQNTRGNPVDENGDTFDTDHLDKNQAIAKDTADWFTYDYIDSIYNARNTIQIGYLVDAPITSKVKTSYTKSGDKWLDHLGNEVKATLVHLDGETILDENNQVPKKPSPTWNLWLQAVVVGGVTKYVAVDEQVISVELEVTGDTRGPIDNTQFIVTLGESIYCNPIKQDIELSAPHFNQGTLEEIKVLALNNGPRQSPTFRVFIKSEIPGELQETFIALRKLDGNTYIIPINWEPNLDDLTQPGDRGYISLSKSFTGPERTGYTSDGQTVTWKPEIKIADTLTGEITLEKLQTSLKEAFNFIFQDDDTLQFGCQASTQLLGSNGFILTTDKVGGFYDIYVSESLLKYISATNIQPGNNAEPGTAVLADIRNTQRCNVIGVVLSNQSGVHKKGETVKVMTLGRMTTLGNLKKGSKYYLGLNGYITTKSIYWYDHHISIGTAESDNTFIVNVSKDAIHSYSGNYPLGYLKPSVKGFADDGFCLADGVTKYSKEEYPELYESLLNWFSEEELKPSNVTQKNFEDLYNKDLVSQYTHLPTYVKNVLEKIEDIKIEMDYFETVIPQLEQSQENVNYLADSLDSLYRGVQEEVDSTVESLKIQYMEIESNMDSLTLSTEESLSSMEETVESYKESLEKLTKNVEDKLNEVLTKFEELQGSDTDQAERLKAIEELNETQTKRLDSIDSKNTEQDTKLQEIETKNTEQDNRLSGIDELNTTQDSKISGIEEDNKTQDSRLKDIEDLNKTQDSTLKEIQDLDKSQSDELAGIKDSNEDLSLSLESLQASSESQSNRLSTLESQASSQTDLVEKLNLTLSSQTNTIEELQKTIETQSQSISNFQELTKDQASTISNLTRELEGLTSKNTELEGSLLSLNTTISLLQTNMENLQSQLNSLSKTDSNVEPTTPGGTEETTNPSEGNESGESENSGTTEETENNSGETSNSETTEETKPGESEGTTTDGKSETEGSTEESNSEEPKESSTEDSGTTEETENSPSEEPEVDKPTEDNPPSETEESESEKDTSTEEVTPSETEDTSEPKEETPNE